MTTPTTQQQSFQSFIEEEYQNECHKQSDIHEHLPTLRALAESVQTVTEFGVRTGSSTRAFLAAAATANLRLRSYDIVLVPAVQELFAQAAAAGQDATYTQADTLQLSIEPTDLLFIDTLHTRAQLAAELSRHAGRVNRYIAFHDTVTYGLQDENPAPPSSKHQSPPNAITTLHHRTQQLRHRHPRIRGAIRTLRATLRRLRHAIRPPQNTDPRFAPDDGNSGLLNALLPFLATHPEWRIHRHYPNNNGLTIITRHPAEHQ